MADFRTVEVPFLLERDEGGDGLTLEGYAAVFNAPARIHDSEGEYDEVFLPGSFKRTADAFRSTENPRRPVLMFNHGRNPLWENMPIGRIDDLYEDERGLHVRARLSDNWLIHPIRDAIRDDAITGMSIRFEPEQQSWSGAGKNRLRTHRSVKLHELGPVTFPAYAETSVAVRSLVETIPELTLVMRDTDLSTSEEPAQGTSEEPADGDPAASHSPVPTSRATREQLGRRLQLDSLTES